MTHDPLLLLFLLIAGHYVGDFALQTEWVATNKNRHIRDKFTPEQKQRYQVIWPHLLTAHSFTHGAIIFLITQNFALTLIETCVHWVVDYGKCEGWWGFHLDQFIHLASKFLWAYLIVKGLI